MGKVKSAISTKHVLILSLAVNLGLLLRTLPEAWSWEGLNSRQGFCLENNGQNRGGTSDYNISPTTEAKVSKTANTPSSSLSPETSIASNGVDDGGESDVINLDQSQIETKDHLQQKLQAFHN